MTERTDLRRRIGRRNLQAVSLTSFLTDVSSEMVLHLVPLYLSALGVGVHVIGWIEGVAKSLTGLVKLISGRLSDRRQSRKWPAVAGYGLSAVAKPFFIWAQTWPAVAAVRWTERLGKGVRTAPRDALLADSAEEGRRGWAFGLHRAADTLGAVVGLGLAIWILSAGGDVSTGFPGSEASALTPEAFHRLVAWSLLPAFGAVFVLAFLARDMPRELLGFSESSAMSKSDTREASVQEPRLQKSGVQDETGGGESLSPERKESRLGRPFWGFLALVALFDLGDSSDAFLVLRAAERGVGTVEILFLLLGFNLVYAATSAPAGWVSDRWGRGLVLGAGWLIYAGAYWGLAQVQVGQALWPLFAVYGAYHGLAHGTAKAMVVDRVPEHLRGTAFGVYHAVLAWVDLPASVIAGWLWHKVSPSAPFVLSAITALCAAVLLGVYLGLERPKKDGGLNPGSESVG